MSENKPLLIALAVVGVLILAFLGYLATTSEPETTITQPIDVPAPEPEPIEPAPEPEPEPETEQVVAEVVPVPEPEPVEEPVEPAFVLPRLDDSDQLIRDGVVSLTRHEGINAWLGPDELIRKIVVFVDNAANGNVAKDAASVLAPRTSFSATVVSDKVFELDTRSYDRYNLVTNIMVSLDTDRSVDFYLLLQPLFQEAYDELGYPNAKFDDAIFRAIGRLLETPVIEERILLVRPVVMFEFRDQKLESLSAAQKQMIRMGPKNTRAIQAKLSEVALKLRSVLEG